jgi:hypothetical protein
VAGNGNAQLKSGTLLTNEQGEMVYAEHHFAVDHLQITTSMHRRAVASVNPCRPSPTARCMTLPTCVNGGKRRATAW